MRVLLIDPRQVYSEELHKLQAASPDLEFLTQEQVGHPAATQEQVDVIVAGGEFTEHSDALDYLVSWRTQPSTYLVPLWITAEWDRLEGICQWARLSIDRFAVNLDADGFAAWLNEIIEWQQSRMQFVAVDILRRRSVLELVTSLALRKASGTLAVYDREAQEGRLCFRDGYLVEAAIGNMVDEEAFFEFLSWSEGSYHWEPHDRHQRDSWKHSIQFLIEEGLRLLREANLLFHFARDLGACIRRTESESALDDGALPFYASQKEIYHLIDGRTTISNIVAASPLSRPRTMMCLSKWFSLGDIALADPEECVTSHRLLIVDDSQLMCKALHNIFGRDRRFEVVGIAHDGIQALELIEREQPDVITLDLQMPRMDGLTALKHIMIREPKPVVILSAFTRETSQLTYESFKYGAVDVCSKPSQGSFEKMESEVRELRTRVAQAATVRMEAAQYIRRSKKKDQGQAPTSSNPPGQESDGEGEGLAIICCGAGGFPSLLKLLFSVPADAPVARTVIAMDMPMRVVDALLPNLRKDCGMPVEMLSPGEPLHSGRCYLYSRDFAYELRPAEGVVARHVSDAKAAEHAFDHILTSTADLYGPKLTAILLSGTGSDGIEGMRRVRECGGQALVLSPEACLKPFLPRAVLDKSDAVEIKTASEMARFLVVGATEGAQPDGGTMEPGNTIQETSS